MFIGEYNHSLDAKGRMMVPAKFRESLGESFVITRSLDACLCIYDREAWMEFAKKLEELPYNAGDQRRLARYFLSGATEVEIDKQGRALIPIHLRQAAKIEKEIVLVGVGGRIEVWSKALWEESITIEEINSIAESMLEGGFRI